MLDPKELRNNFDNVQKSLNKRGKGIDISPFIEIDKSYRLALQNAEEKKAKQNAMNKEVGVLKKEGKDTTELFANMKVLSDEVKMLEAKAKDFEQKINEFLINIPNTPNSQVPEGNSDAENVEIKKYGEPTKFDFEPKMHDELSQELGILDFERGAKVTGSRFTFYCGLGAKLERSLISLMLDTHTSNGYKEILPPVIVNSNSLYGTGQLPKFEEDMFKLNYNDYYLSSTAEVQVTNFHKNEILVGSNLPIKYCAYSPCFRSEAGSAGRDTRGIIRQHQFNKVELVKFVKPEQSYAELQSLIEDAEKILQILELPYRIVLLCGGDLGFSSALTYDIEVWMPSYNRYVEISSCSNFEAFQARRASIRYKDNIKDKATHVHTLNGSGLALSRLFAAIIENNQREDGTISLPKALHSYMGVTELVL